MLGLKLNIFLVKGASEFSKLPQNLEIPLELHIKVHISFDATVIYYKYTQENATSSIRLQSYSCELSDLFSIWNNNLLDMIMLNICNAVKSAEFQCKMLLSRVVMQDDFITDFDYKLFQ